jgi:AcrR family transcriptional regulator
MLGLIVNHLGMNNLTVADRKKREKEQRRNDILNAAERLFFSKGYEEVSMDDIANEIEVTKPTLYLYFENKETLFFAVVFRGKNILVDMIKANISKEKTGLDKVRETARAWRDFAKANPAYLKLNDYFRSGRFDLSEEAINKPGYESAREIIALGQEMLDIAISNLETGMEDGSIRKDLNPTEMSVILITIAESFQNIRSSRLRALQEQNVSLDEFHVHLGTIVCRMIANPDSEAGKRSLNMKNED